MASAEWVNDPFDFRPRYTESTVAQVLKDLKETHGSRRIFSRSRLGELRGREASKAEYKRTVPRPSVQVAKVEIGVAKQTIERLPKKTKLACFCEKPFCIPMWAHYADNHSGICIEYTVDISAAEPLYESIPLPVNYVSARPSIDTLDLRGFTNRSASDRTASDYRVNLHDSIFLSKAIDWEYEKEWRVFETDDQPPRYKEVKALKVAAVYFGLRVNLENKERARSEFGEKIDFFELNPSKTDYTFDPIPF